MSSLAPQEQLLNTKEKYASVYEKSTPDVYDEWAKDGYDEMAMGVGAAAAESISDRALLHLNGDTCRFLSASDDNKGSVVVKALDAGCGTGKVAQVLVNELHKSPKKFEYEWHGIDYSAGMIEVARAKTDLFRDLKQGDLTKNLDMYEDESFHMIVSVGLFLQGHVGPEAIPELCRIVKDNGLMIFTVRPQFWDERKDVFLAALSKGSMKVLGVDSMPYTPDMKTPIVSCIKTGGSVGAAVLDPAPDGAVEMKVTTNKSSSFYIRAAGSSVEATPAEEGREAVEA